jgi:hypothetical protein
MKTSKQARRISLAGAALAAGVSLSAHAEFRCNAPPTKEDARACELAKMARPDELRLFVQRTSSIYGLYFYDYVTESDSNRWSVARPGGDAQSIAAIDGRDKANSVSQ